MRKIIEVKILKDYEVELTYDNNKKVTIDFQKKIESSKIFRPLKNKDFFVKVSIAQNGRYLLWDDLIEFCADALWYEATGEKLSFLEI
jgi:hypothetical protein